MTLRNGITYTLKTGVDRETLTGHVFVMFEDSQGRAILPLILSVTESREMAQNLLEAAEATDSDSSLVIALREQKIPEEQIEEILLAVRRYRTWEEEGDPYEI